MSSCHSAKKKKRKKEPPPKRRCPGLAGGGGEEDGIMSASQSALVFEPSSQAGFVFSVPELDFGNGKMGWPLMHLVGHREREEVGLDEPLA